MKILGWKSNLHLFALPKFTQTACYKYRRIFQGRRTMGLVTSCEACGRGVTGAVTRLQKVNGKYVCADCAKNPSGETRYFCTNCNSYAAYVRNKGNGWIEILLYLFYIVPGIIYSIWRRSGNSKQCPTCGKASLIPLESNAHTKCPDCAELILKDAKRCKHCGCTVALR